MTDHLDALKSLNRNYVRSVQDADVEWFERHLADDFMNSNPDGSIIDRSQFLAQIERGSAVKDLREHDVNIRILGDFAIIHARTAYIKPDGSKGGGRYTDDWQWRDGRWQCVSAHVTRA
jgi:ketosteroid isomerase-like protein